MRLLLCLAVVASAALSGCRNACQEICPRMADYARDCGFEVSQEEVSACVAAQAGAASREDRAVCRDAGDRATLRAEWTCEDLSDYWARARGGARGGARAGARVAVDAADTAGPTDTGEDRP